MKQCNSCLDTKPLTEFYVDRSSRAGYSSKCKVCLRARRRERWHSNYNGVKERDREFKAAKNYSHEQFVFRLARNFNMTEEQYNGMLQEQDFKCALCKLPETRVHHRTNEVQRLSVDHDHSCCAIVPACGNCNRGLLCYECNLLLGKIERTPGLETAIVAYLSKTIDTPPSDSN